jgi:hypothetical protein
MTSVYASHPATANERANSCLFVTSVMRNSPSVLTIYADDDLAHETENRSAVSGVRTEVATTR